MINIVIPEPIKSLQIGKRKYYTTAEVYYSGINWHVRKKLVDACKWQIHQHYVEHDGPLEFPLHIQFKFYGGVRDLDNKGYFWNKVFFDYLKQIKLIPDDNIKYVNACKYMYSANKDERLEIDVYSYWEVLW